jgi:hypothetical protein
MIRMLIVGYCYGIRSERRLAEEVELHLAYRWFCKLDLEDEIPHHSTFSLNRLGRFRESDVLRHVFERVRTERCFALRPKRLAADTAYGTGKFLGWLVNDKGITPHIPVWERSGRADGIFSRADFIWDKRHSHYICPNGKPLRTSGTVHDGRTLLYRASKRDCDVCPLRSRCCTRDEARKIPRDVHEDARDVARRKMQTKAFARSRDERKRVGMRFAHLKTHHGFERLRLRGLSGARDEFHLAAIVQNLKTLALRLVWPPPDLAAASVA